MSIERIGARAALAAVGVLVSVAAMAAPSWAGGTKLCLPKAEGASLVTPKHGKCKRGYTLTLLGTEGAEGKAGAPGKAGAEGKEGKAGAEGKEGKAGAEGKAGPEGKAGFTAAQAEQLKALLPYVTLEAEGLDGKPTVRFTGVNVQIVNGEGSTTTTNGEGNLVIGYDEAPRYQSGSHNLVLGEEQEYTSYGGLVAGVGNAARGHWASVSGGAENLATGRLSSVSGGFGNTASGESSSVSGGQANTASGTRASVSGGGGNAANNADASVSGGEKNTASNLFASVGGGQSNTASGEYASVSGGRENKAKAKYSSIFGSKLLETTTEFEAIP